MKQLRLFLLALLLGLASCFTDDFSPPGGAGEPADPHAVGMDRALADLQSVLSGIDGPTRSVSRTIGTVGTVSKADVSRTRTSAEGNLVYVVSFPEGGYAVLGADDRLPSVIAVVEEGSLTAERYAQMALDGVPVDPSGQFEVFPDIIFGEEDIAAFDIGGGGIGGFGPIGGGGGGTGGGGGGPIGGWDTIGGGPGPGIGMPILGPWETTFSEILLPTKWNQGEPYNYYAPYVGTEKCWAGCVATAVAQIMTYHAYTSRLYPSMINNSPIAWSTICSVLPNKSSFTWKEETIESLSVAHLMRMIGYEVKMDYGLDGSSAYSQDAANCLLKNGYQNAKLVNYTNSAALSMLEKKQPIYIRANNTTESGSAHAWVLDGLLTQKRWRSYKNWTHSVDEYRNLYHCNFGWGGFCDGFYSPGVFDLRDGPKETGGKDSGGKTDQNYESYKQIIIYTGVVRK